MEGELFGWKAQVMVAALGYAIFGVGVETAGITVSKIIVRWFKGKRWRWLWLGDGYGSFGYGLGFIYHGSRRQVLR